MNGNIGYKLTDNIGYTLVGCGEPKGGCDQAGGGENRRAHDLDSGMRLRAAVNAGCRA